MPIKSKSQSYRARPNQAKRSGQRLVIPSRRDVIQLLTGPETISYQFKALCQRFKLKEKALIEAFRCRLLAMVRDRQLTESRSGRYALAKDNQLLEGKVISQSEHHGFLITETGQRIYLKRNQMETVFDADRVQVLVAKSSPQTRREGVIMSVLQRNTETLVGRLIAHKNGQCFLIPDQSRIRHHILIQNADLKAAKNSLVLVRIVQQPAQGQLPEGRVEAILGQKTDPDSRLLAAACNAGIAYEWPEEVLTAAKAYPKSVTSKATEGREDLRDKPFVTIDGSDARDFDDAVFCEPDQSSGWILYVAVADVSHYVSPGTALDVEASQRGNSVYFPGRVIPMLPEVLSNGLCSLKPEVSRLSLVCRMHIDETGQVQAYDFHRAVIRSAARLTYDQAADFFKRKKQIGTPEVQQSLKTIYALYKVLRVSRQQRGAIQFEFQEKYYRLNKQGRLDHIGRLQRNEAHTVIEECMLCANVSAAAFLNKHKTPSLYRNHAGPVEGKLNNLRCLLKAFGLDFPARGQSKPQDYANVLEAAQSLPELNIIQTALLRSLDQAVYSTENVGHFGLSYSGYMHFTSPIRRYPDLIVHRAICAVLDKTAGQSQKATYPYEVTVLQAMAEHCSLTERRADEAVWEFQDFLKADYAQQFIGQQHTGVIAAVTTFGIFIELSELLIEGLVHISALPDDYYVFNNAYHCLEGRQTGRQYRLGDAVEVQVAAVQLEQKKIDFVLVSQ